MLKYQNLIKMKIHIIIIIITITIIDLILRCRHCLLTTQRVLFIITDMAPTRQAKEQKGPTTSTSPQCLSATTNRVNDFVEQRLGMKKALFRIV